MRYSKNIIHISIIYLITSAERNSWYGAVNTLKRYHYFWLDFRHFFAPQWSYCCFKNYTWPQKHEYSHKEQTIFLWSLTKLFPKFLPFSTSSLSTSHTLPQRLSSLSYKEFHYAPYTGLKEKSLFLYQLKTLEIMKEIWIQGFSGCWGYTQKYFKQNNFM